MFNQKRPYISNVNDVLNAVIVEGKPIGKFVIQGEGVDQDLQLQL